MVGEKNAFSHVAPIVYPTADNQKRAREGEYKLNRYLVRNSTVQGLPLYGTWCPTLLQEALATIQVHPRCCTNSNNFQRVCSRHGSTRLNRCLLHHDRYGHHAQHTPPHAASRFSAQLVYPNEDSANLIEPTVERNPDIGTRATGCHFGESLNGNAAMPATPRCNS